MARTLHIDTAETWRGGQNQVLQLVTGLSELGHTAVLVGHDNGELKKRAMEVRPIGFIHEGMLESTRERKHGPDS